MIKINLLSEGKRPAAVRKKSAGGKLEGADVGQWMLLAGIAVGLLAIAAAWYLQDQKTKAKQAEVAAAQREVDQMASVIKEVEDYKEKKAELERKIGIINDLKANQRGPVRVMDYVSRALPELLWLDTMSMKSDSLCTSKRYSKAASESPATDCASQCNWLTPRMAIIYGRSAMTASCRTSSTCRTKSRSPCLTH